MAISPEGPPRFTFEPVPSTKPGTEKKENTPPKIQVPDSPTSPEAKRGVNSLQADYIQKKVTLLTPESARTTGATTSSGEQMKPDEKSVTDAVLHIQTVLRSKDPQTAKQVFVKEIRDLQDQLVSKLGNNRFLSNNRVKMSDTTSFTELKELIKTHTKEWQKLEGSGSEIQAYNAIIDIRDKS